MVRATGDLERLCLLIGRNQGGRVDRLLLFGALSQLRLSVRAPRVELVVFAQSETVLHAAVNLHDLFVYGCDGLRVACRYFVTLTQLSLVIESPTVDNSLC